MKMNDSFRSCNIPVRINTYESGTVVFAAQIKMQNLIVLNVFATERKWCQVHL